MTVNIWKSYMWTADKDVNIKAILAVMNTTWAVVKIRPDKKKKFRPVRDLNPWPLRYRCSVLPTELTSQLGEHYLSSSENTILIIGFWSWMDCEEIHQGTDDFSFEFKSHELRGVHCRYRCISRKKRCLEDLDVNSWWGNQRNGRAC